jgi:hypothetical protein
MNDYWVGPYDVRVKNYIPYVPSKDGVNRVISRNGKLIRYTDIKNTTVLTKEEYLTKFCYYDDGYYYYNASLEHEHNLYICIDKKNMPHFCNIHALRKQRKELQNRIDEAEDDCCIIS